MVGCGIMQVMKGITISGFKDNEICLFECCRRFEDGIPESAHIPAKGQLTLASTFINFQVNCSTSYDMSGISILQFKPILQLKPKIIINSMKLIYGLMSFLCGI